MEAWLHVLPWLNLHDLKNTPIMIIDPLSCTLEVPGISFMAASALLRADYGIVIVCQVPLLLLHLGSSSFVLHSISNFWWTRHVGRHTDFPTILHLLVRLDEVDDNRTDSVSHMFSQLGTTTALRCL
jgi:hypothetical protein